jgi:hypothetical protein
MLEINNEREAPVSRPTAAFIIIFSLFFSICYTNHAGMVGAWSHTKELALLHAGWPYKPRILVAWLTYKIFATHFDIDSTLFRSVECFAFLVPSMALMQSFGRRLNIRAEYLSFAPVCFGLVLLAHYCLPNVYVPYYVYDIPGILFYLISFMLLTSESRAKVLLGAALSLVFYMNRESISVVYFQAVAWHAVKLDILRWKWPRINLKSGAQHIFSIVVIGVTFLITMGMHAVLLKLLDGNSAIILHTTLYEGDQYRIVANIHGIFTAWGEFQQLLAIGFCLVLCLPFSWPRAGKEARAVLLFSAIPLAPALVMGNITETRLYNEFIPIWAYFLTFVLIKSSVVARR